MHLMTLKHWTEAKFFVCSVYGEYGETTNRALPSLNLP